MQIDSKVAADVVRSISPNTSLFAPVEDTQHRLRSMLGFSSMEELLDSIEEAHYLPGNGVTTYPRVELLLRLRCAKLTIARQHWPEFGWVTWSSLTEDVRPWVLGDGYGAQEAPIFDLKRAKRFFARQLRD